MTKPVLFHFICLLLTGALLYPACSGNTQQAETVAKNAVELGQLQQMQIEAYIKAAVADTGRSGDSLVLLNNPELAENWFREHGFSPAWNKDKKWLPVADSVYRFIGDSRLYGLYPEDYHLIPLRQIMDTLAADTSGTGAKMDARWWAAADLLLTDAVFSIVHDIRLGRLPNDSISYRKDSILSDSFYFTRHDEILKNGLSATIKSLEPDPGVRGYHALKAAIPGFLKKAVFGKKTSGIKWPAKDSRSFNAELQARLTDEGIIPVDKPALDSAALSVFVKQYQKKMNLTVDGKAGEGTVRSLNTDDDERFARIAISLDKYKLLPARMPERYILVNVAANYMEVIDSNKLIIRSKVISGKVKTRTPLLNASIGGIITYPQWVPPSSIIEKEILPAVKRSPGYLAKKGFSLVDKNGDEVDPYSVDWSKYSKSIPYRVVQGSGDANALGIIKFVFDNKYAVYLHDTNQRYLFNNMMRSLSHGCVRVQEWDKLAAYILRSDSILSLGTRKQTTRSDSLHSWLKHKQKHSIVLANKLPLFIRYFSCEGQNGQLVFFDDVYGEDKYLRSRYLSGK